MVLEFYYFYWPAYRLPQPPLVFPPGPYLWRVLCSFQHWQTPVLFNNHLGLSLIPMVLDQDSIQLPMGTDSWVPFSLALL